MRVWLCMFVSAVLSYVVYVAHTCERLDARAPCSYCSLALWRVRLEPPPRAPDVPLMRMRRVAWLQMLRQHGPELRLLIFQLAAEEHGREGGRASLAALQEALEGTTAEWGFAPEALGEVRAGGGGGGGWGVGGSWGIKGTSKARTLALGHGAVRWSLPVPR